MVQTTMARHLCGIPVSPTQRLRDTPVLFSLPLSLMATQPPRAFLLPGALSPRILRAFVFKNVLRFHANNHSQCLKIESMNGF